MLALLSRLDSVADPLRRAAPAVLTTLARFVFAGVLLLYFLKSGTTKFDGFGIDPNAYAQILPKAMEAVGYDPSELGIFHHLIVFFGSVAEIILPVLVTIGLATRPAALGMIGFILVQSIVDITGHHADAQTIGALFDRHSNALIVDQRSLWIMVVTIPLLLGGGPLSLDRLIYSKASRTS